MPQKANYTPSNVHVPLFQIFQNTFPDLKTKGNRHDVSVYATNEYSKG